MGWFTKLFGKSDTAEPMQVERDDIRCCSPKTAVTCVGCGSPAETCSCSRKERPGMTEMHGGCGGGGCGGGCSCDASGCKCS